MLGVLGAFAGMGRQSAARNAGVALGAFLMPVFVMGMVGLALRGYSTPSLWVGVLSADSAAALSVVGLLEGDPLVRVRHYEDRERMRIAVYRGRLHGGLVFPAGWDGDTDLELYASKAGAGAPTLRSILDQVLARAGPDAAHRVVSATELDVVDAEALGSPPLGYQYTAPSNIVLFVMINAIVTAGGLVALRRTGLGMRLLAAPLTRTRLTLCLAVAPIQLMTVQAMFLLLIGWLVFDVSWGDPFGVALVTLALILVGTGLHIFLGTTFRTETQAGNFGPFLAIVMGMLGGCMWPLQVVPEWIRSAGHLMPTAWAMDGYLALVFDGAGWTAVLPEVSALLGMAVLFGSVGVLRLQRQLSAR